MHRASTTRTAKKPVAKGKKKPVKKKAAAANAKPKTERKEYDLPGQKRDTPEEGESLRKFYVSLRKQKPQSEMAEVWLMEHGLLPEAEADKAYKRMLIRKGRSAPAAKKKSGGSSSSGSRPKSASKVGSAGSGSKKATPGKKPSGPVKKKLKPGAKRKASVIEDDDSDEDIPLATIKSGGGGGFKIPKKEGGATPNKAQKMAIKEEIGK